ncbi:MAG TPA: oligosaccharide flippase family protein, partial [bacterium]|nr:oligosaccharide flippase family protein [bacterium]
MKKNVIATFGSNVFVALMNLIFVPLYIHFMGIESYGLVGVFSTLLALFALLDMGLGSTLNREFARLGAQNNKGRDMRDLLRTLEVPYWLVAFLIGLGVVVFSPILAHHWFNPKTLSATDVQRAVAAMGIAIAFQWPFSFYSGGLMGRHRQVTLGILNAVLAAFRGLGAVLVLWLFSPTVEAFFGWQIVVS